MAILPNHIKYLVLDSYFSSQTIKIILMDTGFVFDKDVHANYDDGLGADDIIDKELGTGNGYTAGGITVTGYALTEDDTNDQGIITWDTMAWTAAGGSIGPTSGAIIYNDTPVGDANKAVVQWMPFDGDVTVTDGNILPVSGIEFKGV